MIYVVALLLAYLLGSFPTGFVIVWLLKKFDVRDIGSKRTGATNVMRAAGWGAGVFVFIADMFKAAGAVWLGRWLAQSGWLRNRPVQSNWEPLLVGLACGLAAIVGHNWPVYIRFRGGRGVATALGSVLPIAPLVVVGAFLVAVLVVLRSRYVSLGSLVGTNLLSVGILIQSAVTARLPLWAALFGFVIGVLVILRHKDNIARLVAGTERRLGEKVELPQ